MIKSAAAHMPQVCPVPVDTVSPKCYRRRHIAPRAGRALEILGHAIDYLTDEYLYSGGVVWARDPEFEAVQLLMALNRLVYFECPEVPTLRERCRALLHIFVPRSPES